MSAGIHIKDVYDQSLNLINLTRVKSVTNVNPDDGTLEVKLFILLVIVRA
jgi:hypothetical protein